MLMKSTTKYFHPGEVAVQKQWGTDTDAHEQQARQMMLPEVNPNEHAFIDSLTFSAAGSVDASQRPWASPLLSIGDGLFRLEAPTRVRIAAQHGDGDPLAENVAATGELSVVYFDPSTRRRAKSVRLGNHRA